MAEICCGVVGETEGCCDTSSRAARRRRMQHKKVRTRVAVEDDCPKFRQLIPAYSLVSDGIPKPRFGMASVCGRRRDMEDAVAIHPSFCINRITPQVLHYFGVYDGHGCSHVILISVNLFNRVIMVTIFLLFQVAARCRERFHELVKEELVVAEEEQDWKTVMDRSFGRMDEEVITLNQNVVTPNCRCQLKSPACDAVGSTAVIAVISPDEIVVANCGDSRAVLCRNGKPIPLSTDHKPDRPDELKRIQAAGGRVTFCEGARILGVLAMSRAIGDNYLKPYVTWEPEVTVMKRTEDDECLIMASDGLWDVVSNDIACGVARTCLKNGHERDRDHQAETALDNACADASMLLTKLALARRSSDNVSVVVIDIRK